MNTTITSKYAIEIGGVMQRYIKQYRKELRESYIKKVMQQKRWFGLMEPRGRMEAEEYVDAQNNYEGETWYSAEYWGDEEVAKRLVKAGEVSGVDGHVIINDNEIRRIRNYINENN